MIPTEIDGHLTPRELQMAKLVGLGWHNKAIAVELHLSPLTVRVFLSRIYSKLKIGQGTYSRIVLARLVWEKIAEPKCGNCAYVGFARTVQAAASGVIAQDTLLGASKGGENERRCSN
jgi:hypothetical protein